eukprot:210604-Hanusia_phi.AAC.2
MRRPFRNRFGNNKRYSDRTEKWVFEESSPRKGSGDGSPEPIAPQHVKSGSSADEAEASYQRSNHRQETKQQVQKQSSRFSSRKRPAKDDQPPSASKRAPKISKKATISAKNDSKVKVDIPKADVDPFAKTFQLTCLSETRPTDSVQREFYLDSAKGKDIQNLSESAISNLPTAHKRETSETNHLKSILEKEKKSEKVEKANETEHLSDCDTHSSLEKDLQPKMLLFSPHHKRKSNELLHKAQKRFKMEDELIRIEVHSCDDDDSVSELSQNNIFVEKVEARIKLAINQMAKVNLEKFFLESDMKKQIQKKRECLSQAMSAEIDSLSHEIAAFSAVSKGKLDAVQTKHDSGIASIIARGKEIVTSFSNVYEEYKKRMVHVHRSVKSLASAKAARRQISEVKRSELLEHAKSGPASLKAACMAEVGDLVGARTKQLT